MSSKSFRIVMSVLVFSLPLLSHADNFVGAGLGVNFSSLTNLGDDSISGNTAFTADIFADWGLGDIWYLDTALRYTSYGFSGSENNLNVSESAHYLEIPILIKPTFNAGGWYPYLLAGPEIGFKVGEDLTFSGGGQSVTASTSAFNNIDFSADFGAGAEIPIANVVRAFVQFDYALGFVNVFQDSVGTSSHTRGAVLTAGAVMPF